MQVNSAFPSAVSNTGLTPGRLPYLVLNNLQDVPGCRPSTPCRGACGITSDEYTLEAHIRLHKRQKHPETPYGKHRLHQTDFQGSTIPRSLKAITLQHRGSIWDAKLQQKILYGLFIIQRCIGGPKQRRHEKPADANDTETAVAGYKVGHKTVICHMPCCLSVLCVARAKEHLYRDFRRAFS